MCTFCQSLIQFVLIASKKVKRQTIAQEIIRVKKNTSQRVSEEEKKEQMSRVAWKMWRSGYEKRKRKEIMLAGLKGFEKWKEAVQLF